MTSLFTLPPALRMISASPSLKPNMFSGMSLLSMHVTCMLLNKHMLRSAGALSSSSLPRCC